MNKVFYEIQACLPSEEQLQQLSVGAIDNCIAFVCDIAVHFYKGFSSQSLLQLVKSLLLELFRVDIALSSSQSHHCVHKVREAWVQGLESLLRCGHSGTDLQDTKFYYEMVERIMCEVSGNSITLDKIEHLSEAADTMWRTLLKYCEADSTKRELNQREMAVLKSSLCRPLDANKLTSWQLSASFHRIVVFDSSNECGLPHFQPSCLTSLGAVTFSARFLVRISTGVNYSCERVDVVEASCDGISVDLPGDESNPIEMQQQQEIDSDLNVLINIAAAVGVCRVISNDVALSDGSAVDVVKRLEQDLSVLIQQQSDCARRNLARLAFERSMSSGGVWSLSLDVILSLLETNTVDSVLPADAEVFVPVTASGVSTLNIILSHMPRDFVVHFANVLVAMLMSCSSECIASYQSKFINKCEVSGFSVVFESFLIIFVFFAKDGCFVLFEHLAFVV